MSEVTEGLRRDRLDRFAKELRAFGRVRLVPEDLWAAFRRTFPARPPGVERSWFLAALQDAEATGVVRLPPVRSHRWDRSAIPHVPSGVDLVRVQSTFERRAWRSFPWVRELSWVPDLAYLAPEQEEFLHRVHDGIVYGRFREPAPLRHRSLQLTGYEKRLERHMRTILFDPGRLSLELLGAYREITPLAWEPIRATGGRVLVLENAGPFTVARAVLSSMSEAPYDIVAGGAGSGFSQSVAHLATIGRSISAIYYVGDLDAPGLRIAARAAVAAKAAGLPVPIAAYKIHAAMLSAAIELGHPEGWPKEGSDQALALVDELFEFLPGDTRAAAATLIRAGRRIPEEVLGPELMRAIWS